MKNKYILYFFLILAIFIAIFLYMIEIPAPIKNISEEYSLQLK
jgi:hypothetical protein